MLEETLTPGERFWLWSRRNGFRSGRIANLFGVERAVVRDWFRDRQRPPTVYLGGVEIGEQYAILRRRLGMSQKTLGKRIGMSQGIISKAELGRRFLLLRRIIAYFGGADA